ncbi:MAG: asparaginase [Candidatus Eremiobacteraeota bacterium]|nr:asparaginase [Candidatus Eremiobacteraeota bacterium]
MNDDVRVEVTRGELVESIHRVAVCVVDENDTVVFSAGDVERPVYLRSTAKPFITAAVVASGAAERYRFEPRELAVIAGSHFGEPFHVAAVLAILEKIGMDARALQCGPHWPYDESAAASLRASGAAPTALHNNCSGKHAGILALCKTLGADTATYLRPDNPAQRYILEFCARITGDDATAWPLGVDGCGIPVYATSLRKAARSFVRLGNQYGLAPSDARALRVVRDAMLECPQYVAGTGQLDSELMRVGGGAIVAKAGAEGVQGVALPPRAQGYAAKVLDGSSRARGPSTIAVLRELGALDAAQATQLARFGAPKVYNRAGEIVGSIGVPSRA